MKGLMSKYPLVPFFLFATVCLVPLIVLRDFSPSNELRYLSIADEALSCGHFFSFTNHGLVYADKPPLYFWLIMLCRFLFGRHSMLVLSLFSLIPSFVIVAVMDKWFMSGKEFLTRNASASMLMTSFMFLGMAVYLRMDMLMCMFIVLALYAYHLDKPSAFAISTFLALFTKGPVGLLLPVLSVSAHLLLTSRGYLMKKWLGIRFLLIAGGLSLLWLSAAYLEGGKEYLENLLFHQTFDRAVNAFDHKEPFWFYFVVVWGVAAPWCFLSIPTIPSSIRKLKDKESACGFLACTVLVTFVMLSCFSSKLVIYLMPVLPFLTYHFVIWECQHGWKKWMSIVLKAISVFFLCIGTAIALSFPVLPYLSFAEGFSFARTVLAVPAGLLMIVSSVYSIRKSSDGWKRPVLALGASLLLTVLILSPRLPQVNDCIGYKNLCRDIMTYGETEEVYFYGVMRPESTDVFLGRQVHVNCELDVIPEDAVVVTPTYAETPEIQKFMDGLRDSGRDCKLSSSLYYIWSSATGQSSNGCSRPK